MRTWGLWALVASAAAVPCIITVLNDDRPPGEPANEVRLGVVEGEVAFVGRKGGQRVTAGGRLTVGRDGEMALVYPTSTPLPTVAAVPIPTAEPGSEDPQVPGTMQIQIVDALGDLIRDTSVEVGGEVYDAPSGHVTVQDLADGRHVVTAHALGYESVQQTLAVPASGPQAITLEYLCSFVVEAHDTKEGGKPVAGVEISIWEGPPVQRPVKDTITVTVRDSSGGNYDEVKVALRRESDGIRVVRAEGFWGVSIHEEHMQTTNPEAGDMIIGLNGSMWRAGDHTQYPYYSDLMGKPIHSRLRIWDSIVALSESEHDSGHGGTLELERNGGRFNFTFLGANEETRGKVVTKAITGANGQCQFENLPARIYFATARIGDARSFPRIIRPSHSWEKIWYTNESNNQVWVDVTIAGVEVFPHKYIARADVQLKSVDRNIIMSGETDRFGTARFKSVPWGKYRMTVTPPARLDASPASMTLDVDAERPHNGVDAEFDVRLGPSVSGRVLQVGTEEPVEGFPLQLQRKRSEYARTRTDAEGGFSFPNVISGDYRVASTLNRRTCNGFLPAPKSLSFEEPRFEVNDEDVRDLVYYVVPGVETHLSGVVEYEDGSPASDARIGVSVGVTKSGDRADSNGRFDLALLAPESDDEYEVEIHAQVKETIRETLMGPGGKPMSSMTEKIRGSGSSPIAFRAGGTVDGIRITFPLPEDKPAVVGKISTVDGGLIPPQHFSMSVYAYQGRQPRHGRVEPDGSYKIENVEPGPVTVYCAPRGRGISGSDRQTPEPSVSYLMEMHRLEMLENQMTLEFDITLERATHFYGKVIDGDHNPAHEVYVKAIGLGGESYGLGETDRRGVFLVDGIHPGVEHTLVASTEIQGGTLTVLEHLMPPDENIVLMVQLPE